MKTTLLSTAAILLLILGMGSTASAERYNVTRDASGEATIVIHNTSPEAFQARREQAQRAQARLDERREQAREERALERQRERELREARRRTNQAPTPPPVYVHHQRPSFFNGGYPTVSGIGFPLFGPGIIGPGFVNPGFGPGFGPILVNPGFGPGFGPGFNRPFPGNRGFYNRGFCR